MKKMKSTEIKKLMDEFDLVAPPLEELNGYERVSVWIEWLKVRLDCPTIEQLEIRMGNENSGVERTTMTESTTPTTLELDIDTDAGIRLFGRASKKSCERFAKLFRQVWNGLPKTDRDWMRAKWQKDPHENCLLYVDYGPEPINYSSCAFVSYEKQEMWIESRVFERSTDERVKAIIAHELGHLRGHADPEWPDDSEAVANLYATRVWGHKIADGVYTTQECLTLEKLARSLGLNWQVFLWHSDPTKYFIYLRPNEKLRCQCLNMELGYDFEDAEWTIRCLAPERKAPRKKRRLKAK